MLHTATYCKTPTEQRPRGAGDLVACHRHRKRGQADTVRLSSGFVTQTFVPAVSGNLSPAFHKIPDFKRKNAALVEC